MSYLNNKPQRSYKLFFPPLRQCESMLFHNVYLWVDVAQHFLVNDRWFGEGEGEAQPDVTDQYYFSSHVSIQRCSQSHNQCTDMSKSFCFKERVGKDFVFWVIDSAQLCPHGQNQGRPEDSALPFQFFISQQTTHIGRTAYTETERGHTFYIRTKSWESKKAKKHNVKGT